MNTGHFELIYAAVIVLTLLCLGIYYGCRQWQTLRGLSRQADLSPEDRRYHLRQAFRRLISSSLMILLAVLLAGSYVLGQERQAMELSQTGSAVGNHSPHSTPDPEKQRFVNRYGMFWAVFSLILLALVGLALLDFLAIQRFGARHYRQIQADRRAMLERQVARLRSERNGH